MKGKVAHFLFLTVTAWSLLALPLPPGAAAQGQAEPPYLLTRGDVLAMTVPQQPDLSRSLTVDESGRIAVPLIGALDAEGRNLQDLEQEILERIQVYHRNVTRITLEISAYDSKAIYVLGAVTTPGKYARYPVPNAWEAIREAGGVTADGDLSRVRIYREIDGRQVLETYDLASLLDQEGPLAVPPLAPGETVEVPTRPTTPGTYAGRDGVYVTGEVRVPGIYRPEAASGDVLGCILQAGGATEMAAMGEVVLLRQQAEGGLLRFQLDLASYFTNGRPGQNPPVRPGDTIVVPRRGELTNTISTNVGIFAGVLTVLTSVVTLLLTRD